MKRILHNGKITVSPTGTFVPKKFYGSPSTKIVLSEAPIKDGNKLYWNAFETNKRVSGHFDVVTEELGFSGRPIDLPKSFLLAVANRFSRIQVESFKSTSRIANENPLPLIFIGLDMFPAIISQRFPSKNVFHLEPL